ncbi:MAG: hypothetical protein ABSB71_09565 [Candidatus Bathyarchaeia archaeon]|jgi:DNA-binding MarR family transcriptional regulator
MAKKKEIYQWQQNKKSEAEGIVIGALQDGKPHLYGNLVKETKLGRATLTKHLKEMEIAGTVKRTMDMKSKYPYPVSYQLSGKDIIEFSKMSLNELRKDFEIQQKIFVQMKESNATPDHVLEYFFDQFLLECLFTLSSCFKMPKYTSYLVFADQQRYANRMLQLVSLWLNQPQMMKAVEDTFERFMKERNEEAYGVLDKFASQFADQPLAKAVFTLYTVKLTLGEEKDTSREFLKKVIESKVLQGELEKRLEQKVDVDKLKELLEDPGWKIISAKS